MRCEARKSAISIFLTRPAKMSQKARLESMRRGSRGLPSWGSRSAARTMGPAIMYGKKEK